MLVVLTRHQGDLFRLLLQLTGGGKRVYRGTLSKERGGRTAFGNTLNGLVGAGLVWVETMGRGQCRTVHVMAMPEHLVEVPDVNAKTRVWNDINRLRAEGLDEAEVYRRVTARMPLEDEVGTTIRPEDLVEEPDEAKTRDDGAFSDAFRKVFGEDTGYGFSAGPFGPVKQEV